MDPFRALNDDHRLIERVCSALAVYVERLEEADPEDLASFVVFFTELADKRHHTREETVLFEAMIQVGFPWRAGPIPTLEREHAEGRRLVATLEKAAGRAGAWTSVDRVRITDAARSLVSLLRQHIQKEDTILFPVARHNLPEATVAAMGARFEEMEGNADARAETSALRVMAEVLCARYSPASVRRARTALAVMN
jgi:hemerythrin-like domain-containing protein